jgi:membrane-associated phospholipid phosphatase
VDGVVAEAIKISLGRLRPYQSDSPYRFIKGGRSFYSGDVSVNFALATVISKEFPRQHIGFLGIDRYIPLAPVLLYSVAGLVACQRLYSNNHWVSDVYYGALAGYVSGSLAVHFKNKLHLRGLTLTSGSPHLLVASFNMSDF